MDRWKEAFIACVTGGKDPETCARRCAGLPLMAVMEHVERDEEFGLAWDRIAPSHAADSRMGMRLLTPASLEALLWAQCSDEEAAAYFGMTQDEYTSRIESDEDLGRVHELARIGGRAAIRVAQHEKALQGDTGMLTWVGKQALGQTEKVDVTARGTGETGSVTINQVILRELTGEQLERMLESARGIGRELVLEGTAQVTHIEEER